jgi:hypothetical protein
VYAFTDHHFDRGCALAEYHDFHHLPGFGDAHVDFFSDHFGCS